MDRRFIPLDQATGRFINEDTESGTMLTRNLFIYVLNNLLNYYDPAGKSSKAKGGKTTYRGRAGCKGESETTPEEVAEKDPDKYKKNFKCE